MTTLTGRTSPIPDYGCVMTIEEFRRRADDTEFTDDDGHGHPAKDGLIYTEFLASPGCSHDIPADATHVVWFNK